MSKEVAKKLTDEPRSYSSRQLCEFLKETKNIELSERKIRRIFKKNYSWTRTRPSAKEKSNREIKTLKIADLEMLELAAAAGERCLKYLDESGFSLWSSVVYTWMRIGEQKKIEQGKRKGKG
ncbi:hypothetical protein H6G48_11415 [Microcystis flos-aquae FACHB-1344]|jgi:predicted glycosyltransferase involved in capsule biosynthesis|uniref:Transposase n=1 Tax=Microcystis flos-aquae FACHB-1344 TaxID=2692899 RepID=A0ABR8HUD0_9CHRO|nr:MULTISPECIES: hypothetical protein [Microcystis]MBD2622257.1 hypothetical protein [Microcystis flos-aquae FACHB-1344]MCA2701983.1 hypothetical protein [Microcystis sp. M179S2]